MRECYRAATLQPVHSNQIGDEGMKAFSTVIASGALGKLETLYVDNPSEQLKAYCSSVNRSIMLR